MKLAKAVLLCWSLVFSVTAEDFAPERLTNETVLFNYDNAFYHGPWRGDSWEKVKLTYLTSIAFKDGKKVMGTGKSIEEIHAYYGYKLAPNVVVITIDPELQSVKDSEPLETCPFIIQLTYLAKDKGIAILALGSETDVTVNIEFRIES